MDLFLSFDVEAASFISWNNRTVVWDHRGPENLGPSRISVGWAVDFLPGSFEPVWFLTV
jgi:hypothetical protein